MKVDLAETLAAEAEWVGFREGPNNDNPFGPIQGVSNAAYCESFADGIPFQHGYDHRIGLSTSRTQFGAAGDAYTPWGVTHARERGEWLDDNSSQGRPADLRPGDHVFFAWNDGVGPEPDHVETAVASYADGTFDTIGANTGTPNGVWRVRRDRKYLLGRRRPALYAMESGPPVTRPCHEQVLRRGDSGPCVVELQRLLHIVVDGDFGADTEAAVQAWQRTARITVDGVVGPDTWAVLTASPPPPPPPPPVDPWAGDFIPILTT